MASKGVKVVGQILLTLAIGLIVAFIGLHLAEEQSDWIAKNCDAWCAHGYEWRIAEKQPERLHLDVVYECVCIDNRTEED